MTKAAQDYFKAYYKLQRIIDENIQDPQMEERLRLELKKAYDEVGFIKATDNMRKRFEAEPSKYLQP
jgi:hypothetical protein